MNWEMRLRPQPDINEQPSTPVPLARIDSRQSSEMHVPVTHAATRIGMQFSERLRRGLLRAKLIL